VARYLLLAACTRATKPLFSPMRQVVMERVTSAFKYRIGANLPIAARSISSYSVLPIMSLSRPSAISGSPRNTLVLIVFNSSSYFNDLALQGSRTDLRKIQGLVGLLLLIWLFLSKTPHLYSWLSTRSCNSSSFLFISDSCHLTNIYGTSSSFSYIFTALQFPIQSHHITLQLQHQNQIQPNQFKMQFKIALTFALFTSILAVPVPSVRKPQAAPRIK